ncbi:hypothetical protein AWB72_00610 [Caballeronia concitans]|uniref:Uncharacterized protein n=1 Tax=Caballeronia concitans TaxID=1777133 RepID=A0A658QRQ7_9BURK|nr:hypothetical protein BurMR1_5219 [Burkholderia sp. MR1]SAL13972.1 hypothetical protein AWB72_00610 [Caballeronia concitans]
MTPHPSQPRVMTMWSELRGVALHVLADFARTA